MNVTVFVSLFGKLFYQFDFAVLVKFDRTNVTNPVHVGAGAQQGHVMD